MIGVLVVCGVMVTSAQAEFEILENPHGLDLRAAVADGINQWEWDSDTFGTAYANGQLDVEDPNGGVRYGAATNLVDGDGGTLGLIMYDGFTATYALNSSYDGPRALGGGQWNHAMRIGIEFHENWNDYDLEVYYQTTDAPGVWQTLFKVRDPNSNPAWKQTCIYVLTDAASLAINNINTIAIKSWEVTQSGGGIAGGGLTELDVNMMFSILSGNDETVTSPAWVNPATASFIDTGATYTWFDTDTGNDPDNTVLQSNTQDSAWGTWDGQDKNIFDFDLKKPYLITNCTVGALFSSAWDGTLYDRGVGRVDVYLSNDGVSFDSWASWVDDDPGDSPAGTDNSMYRIHLAGPTAKAQYVRYDVSKSGGLADYHQTALDEAIIWGATYSSKGDLNDDGVVDVVDLGLLAGNWLLDTTPNNSTVDDFESYTATGPGTGTLLNSWTEFPEAPGQSMMTLLTQPADAQGGDQAMRWEYDVASGQWAEIVWVAGSPVNLSLYDEMRFWVKRHAGNSEASLLYVKFLEGTSTSEIAAEWYLSQADGSTYADPNEWVELVVDLNNLNFGGTAALGYTELSQITAVEQIMIGCYHQTTAGTGTIDVDDVRLLGPTVIVKEDINGDFHVNLLDFALLAEDWLYDVQ